MADEIQVSFGIVHSRADQELNYGDTIQANDAGAGNAISEMRQYDTTSTPQNIVPGTQFTLYRNIGNVTIEAYADNPGTVLVATLDPGFPLLIPNGLAAALYFSSATNSR